ncbi:GntR family transcriptional regulator, gluconate operon transcriptional repressor [Evansella caseinilytica]|uniref:GntR family transcriptional regulator, gluconate operon transcriptional repressor n=1 Tax=Evansella caseinilytica TaxID=1503961 RepID=A0A1H3G6X5_9BACI|nr:GntR family transcriptional regulator [Evansella caseinilytica]SDX99082.1 GntR family transcriptional regulator, gluconate operon transcriptional repressor [Evansella caseinilytica]
MSFPVERLPSSSKGDEIASLMRFEIISGRLKKGDVVSENSLAKTYHASRSPAREALRILQAEGLLRLERLGAVVVGLTEKDMEEINDVRFLIESFVMKECAKNANDSLYAYLRYTLENMRISAINNDFVEFSIQDITFHEAIIEASNHKRILHVWKGIKNIVVTALLIATEKRMMERDQIDNLIKKHSDIIDAMKDGDAQKIEDALKIHFVDTRKTVFESIFTNQSMTE